LIFPTPLLAPILFAFGPIGPDCTVGTVSSATVIQGGEMVTRSKDVTTTIHPVYFRPRGSWLAAEAGELTNPAGDISTQHKEKSWGSSFFHFLNFVNHDDSVYPPDGVN
jgi:hypothetical protein